LPNDFTTIRDCLLKKLFMFDKLHLSLKRNLPLPAREGFHKNWEVLKTRSDENFVYPHNPVPIRDGKIGGESGSASARGHGNLS
jgi:hypothetical protein